MRIGKILWSKLGLGSTMASITFVCAIFKMFIPHHLRVIVQKKFRGLLYPYIQITFPEFIGEKLNRNEAYTAIQTYLSEYSSKRATRLTAEVVKDSKTPLVLSMDKNQEITDEFKGVKVGWAAYMIPKAHSTSLHTSSDERRYLKLTFHQRYRDLITSSYIQHVINQGKEIASRNRQLKLYTNNSKDGSGHKNRKWSHIRFEHPARFETLAMDPKKKEEIINDLDMFRNGKEYYAKVGKAWKRGYLLYGPPGTGKSTMIAAMANFMNYDVYDLELTAVKENTELKKLLIETSSKSIIVIEDIDCSLDLTGQRTKTKKEKVENGSEVTLSGMLNFIDGIWSACGGERIIIFTTNFVDKLDPALIRRGRMDKHIEMSYCSYEAFKVLAKNYLGIDDDSHSLFPIIEKLLGETNMSPADVAESLMPKTTTEDSDTSLQKLIHSLENAKEEAKKKEEEEAKLKAEKDKEELAQEEEV